VTAFFIPAMPADNNSGDADHGQVENQRRTVAAGCKQSTNRAQTGIKTGLKQLKYTPPSIF